MCQQCHRMFVNRSSRLLLQANIDNCCGGLEVTISWLIAQIFHEGNLVQGLWFDNTEVRTWDPRQPQKIL